MGLSKVHFSSAHDNWSTPRKVYEGLNEEFSFDFDPCPLNEAANTDGAQLSLIIDSEATDPDKSIDGLYCEWGKSNFVNPPYSQLGLWLKKAFEEWQKVKTVVLLIPSRTDTIAWHKYAMRATEIRFVKGRLKFGDATNSAPFPSAIIIFKAGVR